MTDQTFFNEQEPLLEEVWRPEPEEIEEADLASEKNSSKLKLGLALGGVSVAGLIIVLGLLLRMSPEVVSQPDASPTPAVEVPVSESTVEKRLQEVRIALQAADPAKEVLAFPAIDMEIVFPED